MMLKAFVAKLCLTFEILWLLIVVFYLRAAFGTGIDSAIIESDTYNISTPSCLTFYYQISSPTIVLNVFAIQLSTWILLSNFTYYEQLKTESWNKAVVAVNGGVTKLRLNAEKFGITENSQFVNVDRVILREMNACQFTG